MIENKSIVMMSHSKIRSLLPILGFFQEFIPAFLQNSSHIPMEIMAHYLAKTLVNPVLSGGKKIS
jgi:hypothetical protein